MPKCSLAVIDNGATCVCVCGRGGGGVAVAATGQVVTVAALVLLWPYNWLVATALLLRVLERNMFTNDPGFVQHVHGLFRVVSEFAMVLVFVTYPLTPFLVSDLIFFGSLCLFVVWPLLHF
jgi:hypothetical protein